MDCPNCLIELDEDRYCNGCGFTLRSGAIGAQPGRVESLDKGFPGPQTGAPQLYAAVLACAECGEPLQLGHDCLAIPLRGEATGAQPRRPEARLPSPAGMTLDASHPSNPGDK
jgi:hypothetical protein